MSERVVFTKQMKKDYTILIPTMLPTHFTLISDILNSSGYHSVLLQNSGRHVVECGLKYVHNDTCYPALLVIGQFIDAIESGRFDPHRVALMLTQTGGGCRASNYISLLRKALAKAGYGYIPVISLNVIGLEKNPGFKVTPFLLIRTLHAILYGDLLMTLGNQCRPYELVPGETDALCETWRKKLEKDIQTVNSLRYSSVKANCTSIVRDFAAIKTSCDAKIKVGIVGEIFVKFSPLGNNNLEEFLLSERAEPVVPGLLDFILYCVCNGIHDTMLYGTRKIKAFFSRLLYRFLIKKQADIIDIISSSGRFRAPTPFEHTHTLAKDYIGPGAKMGEGWLLTAEILELIEQGVNNIVCTQPFGCLPNHIVGKGMMKPIKERNPDVNIIAIDYDPGATRINQENRLKLMLSNAASPV